MADTQTRLQLLATGRRASSSRSAVTTTVRWTSRARVSPLRRPGADQLITVDPDIVAMTERLVRKTGPVLADAFTRRLVPVAQNAYDEWPVATNLSRSRLAVMWDTTDDTLTFQIEAGADYSTAINDGATVRDLLVRPVLEATRQIAADTAKGLGS